MPNERHFYAPTGKIPRSVIEFRELIAARSFDAEDTQSAVALEHEIEWDFFDGDYAAFNALIQPIRELKLEPKAYRARLRDEIEILRLAQQARTALSLAELEALQEETCTCVELPDGRAIICPVCQRAADGMEIPY